MIPKAGDERYTDGTRQAGDMGTYGYTIQIHLEQSAHNSINDELDIVRTKFLLDKLRELISHPDYEALHLEMSHDIDGRRAGQ